MSHGGLYRTSGDASIHTYHKVRPFIRGSQLADAN